MYLIKLIMLADDLRDTVEALNDIHAGIPADLKPVSMEIRKAVAAVDAASRILNKTEVTAHIRPQGGNE